MASRRKPLLRGKQGFLTQTNKHKNYFSFSSSNLMASGQHCNLFYPKCGIKVAFSPIGAGVSSSCVSNEFRIVVILSEFFEFHILFRQFCVEHFVFFLAEHAFHPAHLFFNFFLLPFPA